MGRGQSSSKQDDVGVLYIVDPNRDDGSEVVVCQVEALQIGKTALHEQLESLAKQGPLLKLIGP